MYINLFMKYVELYVDIFLRFVSLYKYFFKYKNYL